ncbi:MAG: DUF5667 domain-containing protein [Halanaerobacter sp.]
MKKIVIILLALSLLAPGVYAVEKDAQEEEDDLIAPDSKFYFLDRLKEKIDLFLASDEEKAKLKTEHGKERLAEAKKMMEQDKPEKAKQALKEGMQNLGQSAKKRMDDLFSEEEWENIKSEFGQTLEELEEKMNSTEVKEKVEDFFNPEENN